MNISAGAAGKDTSKDIIPGQPNGHRMKLGLSESSTGSETESSASGSSHDRKNMQVDAGYSARVVGMSGKQRAESGPAGAGAGDGVVRASADSTYSNSNLQSSTDWSIPTLTGSAELGASGPRGVPAAGAAAGGASFSVAPQVALPPVSVSANLDALGAGLGGGQLGVTGKPPMGQVAVGAGVPATRGARARSRSPHKVGLPGAGEIGGNPLGRGHSDRDVSGSEHASVLDSGITSPGGLSTSGLSLNVPEGDLHPRNPISMNLKAVDAAFAGLYGESHMRSDSQLSRDSNAFVDSHLPQFLEPDEPFAVPVREHQVLAAFLPAPAPVVPPFLGLVQPVKMGVVVERELPEGGVSRITSNYKAATELVGAAASRVPRSHSPSTTEDETEKPPTALFVGKQAEAVYANAQLVKPLLQVEVNDEQVGQKKVKTLQAGKGKAPSATLHLNGSAAAPALPIEVTRSISFEGDEDEVDGPLQLVAESRVQLQRERPPERIETQLIKDAGTTRQSATTTLRGRDLRVRPVEVEAVDAAKLKLAQRNEALYATVGARMPREVAHKNGTWSRVRGFFRSLSRNSESSEKLSSERAPDIRPMFRAPVRGAPPSVQNTFKYRSASSSRVSVFSGDVRNQTGLGLRTPFTAVANGSQAAVSPRVFSIADSRQMSLSGTVRSEPPVMPSNYNRSYSTYSAASTLPHYPRETSSLVIGPQSRSPAFFYGGTIGGTRRRGQQMDTRTLGSQVNIFPPEIIAPYGRLEGSVKFPAPTKPKVIRSKPRSMSNNHPIIATSIFTNGVKEGADLRMVEPTGHVHYFDKVDARAPIKMNATEVYMNQQRFEREIDVTQTRPEPSSGPVVPYVLDDVLPACTPPLQVITDDVLATAYAIEGPLPPPSPQPQLEQKQRQKRESVSSSSSSSSEEEPVPVVKEVTAVTEVTPLKTVLVTERRVSSSSSEKEVLDEVGLRRNVIAAAGHVRAHEKKIEEAEPVLKSYPLDEHLAVSHPHYNMNYEHEFLALKQEPNKELMFTGIRKEAPLLTSIQTNAAEFNLNAPVVEPLPEPSLIEVTPAAPAVQVNMPLQESVREETLVNAIAPLVQMVQHTDEPDTRGLAVELPLLVMAHERAPSSSSTSSSSSSEPELEFPQRELNLVAPTVSIETREVEPIPIDRELEVVAPDVEIETREVELLPIDRELEVVAPNVEIETTRVQVAPDLQENELNVVAPTLELETTEVEVTPTAPELVLPTIDYKFTHPTAWASLENSAVAEAHALPAPEVETLRDLKVVAPTLDIIETEVQPGAEVVAVLPTIDILQREPLVEPQVELSTGGPWTSLESHYIEPEPEPEPELKTVIEPELLLKPLVSLELEHTPEPELPQHELVAVRPTVDIVNLQPVAELTIQPVAEAPRTPSSVNQDVNVVVPVAPLVDVLQTQQVEQVELHPEPEAPSPVNLDVNFVVPVAPLVDIVQTQPVEQLELHPEGEWTTLPNETIEPEQVVLQVTPLDTITTQQTQNLESPRTSSPVNLDMNVVVPVTPLMDILRMEQPTGSEWMSLENPFIEPELALPAFNVNVNTTEPILQTTPIEAPQPEELVISEGVVRRRLAVDRSKGPRRMQGKEDKPVELVDEGVTARLVRPELVVGRHIPAATITRQKSLPYLDEEGPFARSQARKSYVHIKRPKALSPSRGVDAEVSAEFANEDEDIVDEALVDELLGDSDGEDLSSSDLPIEYEWRRAKHPNPQASGPASGSFRVALRGPPGGTASVSNSGPNSVGRAFGGQLQLTAGESHSASGPASPGGSIGRKVSWGKVHVRGAAPTLPAAFLQPKPASVSIERQYDSGNKKPASEAN